MNKSKVSQRAPEVQMIVFLKEPLWIDRTVTELSRSFSVGDAELKWGLVKSAIGPFIFYTDEEEEDSVTVWNTTSAFETVTYKLTV